MAMRRGAVALMVALAFTLLVPAGCEEKQAATGQGAEEATPPAAEVGPPNIVTDAPGRAQGETLEVEEAPRVPAATPDDEWAVMADPAFKLQPSKIRVRIYWANDVGQVIHSQTQAYPDGYAGERADVSIEGAHIAMKINRLQIRKTSSGGVDLNELARTLRDLFARQPLPVVIESRSAVPFRYVIGAVDACARARMDSVVFGGVPGQKPLDPCAILLDDRESLYPRDGLRMAMPFSLTTKPEAADGGQRLLIVVNVLYPGETIIIRRRVLKPEALDTFIESKAEAAGTDEDGRSRLAARIRCDSACTFQPVLHIMRACAKAGIADVTFAARTLPEEDLIRLRRAPGERY